MAKIILCKTAADGEAINVEVELTKQHYDAMSKGAKLYDVFKPFFDFCDDRMIEMNERIIASNFLVQRLSPEARVAFNSVVDVLAGRTAGPAREEVIEAARAEVRKNKEIIAEHERKVAEEDAAEEVENVRT